MTSQQNQIPLDDAPCFGVGCHIHGSCHRYHAVDESDPDLPRIGNCGPEHSAYIAILPAAQRDSTPARAPAFAEAGGAAC